MQARLTRCQHHIAGSLLEPVHVADIAQLRARAMGNRVALSTPVDRRSVATAVVHGPHVVQLLHALAEHGAVLRVIRHAGRGQAAQLRGRARRPLQLAVHEHRLRHLRGRDHNSSEPSNAAPSVRDTS